MISCQSYSGEYYSVMYVAYVYLCMNLFVILKIKIYEPAYEILVLITLPSNKSLAEPTQIRQSLCPSQNRISPPSLHKFGRAFPAHIHRIWVKKALTKI